MHNTEIKSNVAKFGNRRSSTPMFQAETPKETARKKVLNAVKRDAGKYISFPDEGITGLFAGACMYDNYPHFVIIDKDRKAQYVNADNVFTMVKQVPGNLSILDYLREHEPEFIQEVAENAIKNSSVSQQLGEIVVKYNYNPTQNFSKKFNKSNKKNNKK